MVVAGLVNQAIIVVLLSPHPTNCFDRGRYTL